MSFTLDELLAEVASAPSVTPADQDPRLGTMVGPYKVQERLGRGGMGTVYLARDTRLERDVALKMLHDESPLACKELLREARRAATVSHASIAQVFDVNEEPPPYIAMELVRGDSLYERITKDPPGPEESLRILGDTADAVAALHAHGIVHRDLTPRNIALTADGRLKILDFGIAMPLEETLLEKTPLEKSKNQTESESILYAGTERYVSPERAEGRAPSAKDDVFSIGVLASDLFAEEPPPQAVAQLLARCRSLNEAERPSDLRAVAKQLRAAHPAPRSKRATLLIAAISALALAAYLMVRLPAAQPEETRAEQTTEMHAPADVQPTRLTFYAEDQSIQAMSGNGDVFFVTDTLGVSRFNGENESERLALPPGFRATSAHGTSSGVLVLGVSEDGAEAYYYSDDEPSPLATDSHVNTLSVAHDGHQVALLDSNTIRIGTLDVEHRTLLETETLQVEVEGALLQTASWSPDNRRLLVMTWQDAQGRLEEVDITTGQRRSIFESAALVGRLGSYAFTYVDDDTIAFSMHEPSDASIGIYVLSRSQEEEPRLVARIPTSIEELHWCTSRASFRFVAYDPDYKLYRRLITEDEPQRMTFSDHQDWATSFSLDGEDIHFSRMTAAGSQAFSVPRSSPSAEVAVVLNSAMDLPGPTRALREGLDAWLAFVPREDGRHELLHISATDTRSLAQIPATPGRWRAPPFGAQVRQGGGRLFFGLSTNETLRISEFDGTQLRGRFAVEGADDNSWFVFAVSHDGERFVHRDAEGLVLTDEQGIVTQRISRGSEVLQSAGFLRDRSLVVTAASARQFSLFHMNLETGETTVLASSYHRWFGSVATSPTRDEIAYTTVGWDTDVFEVTPAL